MEVKVNSFDLYGIPLNDICLKVIESIKENKDKITNDKLLGKISYIIKDDLLEISFSNIPGETISIYKNPIIFKNEKNERVYTAFNENLLKEAINLSSNSYEFYVK